MAFISPLTNMVLTPFLRELNQNRLAVEARRQEVAETLLDRTGEGSRLVEDAVTICSVNYHNGALLMANAALTESLNPVGQATIRLVTDNSSEFTGREDTDALPFTVVDGSHSGFRSSFGHAAGLTELLPHIQTRFVLFLDPDCFIVRPNWISDVLLHMREQNLAFFGAPAHPKVVSRYRYFPTVICMFVDLAQVPLLDLDFSGGLGHPANQFFFHYVLPSISRLPRPLGSILARLRIESLHDVGYPIYTKYRRSSKYECLVPVDSPTPTHGWKGVLNSNVPDRLSWVPKKDGYFSESGFRDLGYFDARGQGWEEFLWQQEPFAFHIRGVTRDADKRKDLLSAFPDAIASFSKRGPGSVV